jgi:hypothetical protein
VRETERERGTMSNANATHASKESTETDKETETDTLRACVLACGGGRVCCLHTLFHTQFKHLCPRAFANVGTNGHDTLTHTHMYKIHDTHTHTHTYKHRRCK